MKWTAMGRILTFIAAVAKAAAAATATGITTATTTAHGMCCAHAQLCSDAETTTMTTTTGTRRTPLLYRQVNSLSVGYTALQSALCYLE